MPRLWFVLAAAIVFSASAHAQEPVPADPLAALAERHIADANAAGIFVVDPAPNSGNPRVRHVSSGLRCTLSNQITAARIRVLDEMSPRGDSVQCSTSTEWVGQALFARRLEDGLSLDEDLRRFETETRTRFPRLAPHQDALPALTRVDGIEERSVTLSNARSISFLRVAHVGGWSVRMIYSAPAAAVDTFLPYANSIWASAVGGVAEAQTHSTP